MLTAVRIASVLLLIAVDCGAARASDEQPSRIEPPFTSWRLASASASDVAEPDAVPARDAKAFTLSGFYSFELAYTYGEPQHWSRAVNRLQLTGDGSFGAVKYKVGARVDVDPLYASSHFYPSDVKRDQRFDAIWRENYLDWSAGDWDFRVGAQHIIWGEVVGLFFADVVSAKDQREFLLPSFDLIRIPQWAARAEYYAGDSHLELVWIPLPTFDRIGKPGSDFYPFPLPSPTSPSDAAVIGDITRPARTLSNSSYGMRANTLISGWDLAAFYYRSFDTQPSFYRVNASPSALPQFAGRYDRLSQFGATVGKDFGSFVLRGEAVYARGRTFLSSDPAAPEGIVERSTVDYIVGAEAPFANDGRLNVQVFQRIFAGGRHQLAFNPGDFGFTVLATTKLGHALEPQILWIQTVGGGGGLIRPSVSWKGITNVTLTAGLDVFTGTRESTFGRFNNRDRIYTELRYDF